LWVLRWGNKILSEEFPQRRKRLEKLELIRPTIAELTMGIICLLNLAINLYLKYESKSLIFMFNPCHVVNFFLIIVSLRSHGRLGELCALAIYSFAFGGYIGIIFNEN
jgi:hypothetical protein